MATNSNGMITLNHEFCNIVHNTNYLKNNVYPDQQTNIENREWLCERAILAPTNKIVGQINVQLILSHMKSDVVEYLSIDNVLEIKQVTSYYVEFLNSLELSRVFSNTLMQKVIVQDLLIRNLGVSRLCNGTQLQLL